MIIAHFPIIDIADSSVSLNNSSYPPTIILSFPSMNCTRITMMTNDFVVFILIRVLNNELTVMEHYILYKTKSQLPPWSLSHPIPKNKAEASICVSKMFKSHIYQQYGEQI
jgi:hypothetical protein